VDQNRDQELERLVRTLRQDEPYIEKPDELDVDVGGGCFLDRHRVCGNDCTAYGDAAAPTAVERCTLLSGVSRGLALLGELVELRRPVRRPIPTAPYIEPPDPHGPTQRREGW
jgi:hypothetical protein